MIKIVFTKNYEKAHKKFWTLMKDEFKKSYDTNFYIYSVYGKKCISIISLKNETYKKLNKKDKLFIDDKLCCAACNFVNRYGVNNCPIKFNKFYNSEHCELKCVNNINSPYKKLIGFNFSNDNEEESFKLFDEIINLKWKPFIIIKN